MTAGKIKYLVIDVDGTMTDAGIYYDENGNEWKKFCTKDAAGIFAARRTGIKIIIITGRECEATRRRMTELKVDFLEQNVKDKYSFLLQFMQDNNISKEELGYIGDDLNDLQSMMLAGFIGCPSDSCSEVIHAADYISSIRGGHGAVRDIIEHMLRNSGDWNKAVSEIYNIGV